MQTVQELYSIYLKHPSIQTDTRKLKNGDLFFALKGPSFNGNHFAQYAIEKGAQYVIVDELAPSLEGNPKVLLVEDVLQSLQQLALLHREHLNIPFLAITGSNGKTTTKELIYAVLSAQYKTVATSGNLNNHIGVPLTILSIPNDTEIAIIEMGANHLLEIASYCEIALPTHAIINNCGKAHLEGFGSLEGVKKAKGELYDFIRATDGMIFINNDLDYLQEMSKGILHRETYGTVNAQVIGKDISDNPFLKLAVLSSGLETTIQTQLIGSYNLPNILAAIAVGNYFKIPIDTIKASLEAYAPNNSRSQLIITAKNNTIILDAYNANPSSMELAIRNFAQMNSNSKILLLGAMKEMGKDSDEEHQKVIALCQSLQLDQVFLVGSEFNTNQTQHNYLQFCI